MTKGGSRGVKDFKGEEGSRILRGAQRFQGVQGVKDFRGAERGRGGKKEDSYQKHITHLVKFVLKLLPNQAKKS